MLLFKCYVHHTVGFMTWDVFVYGNRWPVLFSRRNITARRFTPSKTLFHENNLKPHIDRDSLYRSILRQPFNLATKFTWLICYWTYIIRNRLQAVDFIKFRILTFSCLCRMILLWKQEETDVNIREDIWRRNSTFAKYSFLVI